MKNNKRKPKYKGMQKMGTWKKLGKKNAKQWMKKTKKIETWF
jgi:hypothetical protein